MSLFAPVVRQVSAQSQQAVFVSAEELSQWPAAAVAAMKSQKLLARARPAVSVVCPGCERECVMPVHTLPAGPRGPASFIVCDKRDDINRVSVSADRLMQWRCDADAVCGFIAVSLGLRRTDQHPADAGLLNIGMASGDKRSQMLNLRVDGELALVSANNAVPLAELVDYSDGEYSVDGNMIRQLVEFRDHGKPSLYAEQCKARDAEAPYADNVRGLAEGIPRFDEAMPEYVRRVVLAADRKDGYCEWPQR